MKFSKAQNLSVGIFFLLRAIIQTYNQIFITQCLLLQIVLYKVRTKPQSTWQLYK